MFEPVRYVREYKLTNSSDKWEKNEKGYVHITLLAILIVVKIASLIYYALRSNCCSFVMFRGNNAMTTNPAFCLFLPLAGYVVIALYDFHLERNAYAIYDLARHSVAALLLNNKINIINSCCLYYYPINPTRTGLFTPPPFKKGLNLNIFTF